MATSANATSASLEAGVEPANQAADRIVSETGQDAVAVPGDVTSRPDRIGMLEQVEARRGPVDILANVAGVGQITRFVDEDPARVLTTNLEAPIQLTRLVVPAMIQRGFGRILNVASLAGWSGLPFFVDYSASKAGLIAFSLALREELRGSGVLVTVVSPGFIIDEGMYVAYQTPAPRHLGGNRSRTIGRDAVLALRKKRRNVILNGTPLRPLVAIGSVSDCVMRGIARTLGTTLFPRRLAEKRMPYSDSTSALRPEGKTVRLGNVE